MSAYKQSRHTHEGCQRSSEKCASMYSGMNCTNVNVYIYVYRHAHAHVCIDTCMNMCTYACTYVCIDMCIDTCVDMCIDMCKVQKYGKYAKCERLDGG